MTAYGPMTCKQCGADLHIPHPNRSRTGRPIASHTTSELCPVLPSGERIDYPWVGNYHDPQ